MRQPGASAKAQQGFTLLEVVLSMALTAMLLGLLSSGMYSVVRDWENDTDVLDTRLNHTVALLQIERALQGAFAHSYLDQESLGRFIYFLGEDDSLVWVSSVSPQRRGGLTAWWLENDPEQGVLLRLAPAMSDNPTSRLDNTEPIVLLENYTATFSYMYEELDFSKRWRDDWPGDELGVLPLAIHVLLTPSDDGAARTETLEVVTRIRANEHSTIRPAFAALSDSGVGGFNSNRQPRPGRGGSR